MAPISKTEIYILLVFAIISLVFMTYKFDTPGPDYRCGPAISYVARDQAQRRPQPDEQMKKSIFYARLHKTASSTFTNILMRLAYRHSLDCMFPEKAGGQYLGYEAPMRLEELADQTIPLDGKFDLLFYHSRYWANTSRLLRADVLRVTTVREPSSHLESVFGFYKLERRLKMPWRQFVRSLKASADRVFTVEDIGVHLQLRNMMSYELGLQPAAYDDERQLAQFVRFVDEQFDLVLILEYMEASLVLLADQMAWPLHYVTFFRFKQRPAESRAKLSAADRRKIARYNRADHLLYARCLARLRVRAQRYGFDRLAADVRRLDSMNANYEQRCLRDGPPVDSRAFADSVKNHSDIECELRMQNELAFKLMLRQRQTSRVQLVGQLQKLRAVPTAEDATDGF